MDRQLEELIALVEATKADLHRTSQLMQHASALLIRATQAEQNVATLLVENAELKARVPSADAFDYIVQHPTWGVLITSPAKVEARCSALMLKEAVSLLKERDALDASYDD